MSAVLRPLLIYVGLLLVFRVSGKRSLGEITNFDFVVLLIAAGAAMAGWWYGVGRYSPPAMEVAHDA